MTSKKTALGIFLTLTVLTALLWSIETYIRPGYQCGTDSLERAKKTYEVFKEYKRFFYRYPGAINVDTAFLRNEKTGLRTETWGIVIIVDEKIEEEVLPPDFRIPDSLEGIPVQIIPAETAWKAESFQRNSPFKNEPHVTFANDVREKNREFFRRNPFYESTLFINYVPGTEPGNRIANIELVMSKKVNQLSLSPAVRIPDCLEDVPIKFIEPLD